jgi:hypothetical protein
MADSTKEITKEINKECHKCRKSLELSHFTDEKGKVLGKCNPCRIKLIKTTNKCSICGVKAIYNILGETEGVRCKEHKEIDMIDIKRKKCQEKGCKIQPIFNFKGEKNGLFCDEHKKKDMINVKDRLCKVKDCKTRPTFNFEGKEKAVYCLQHRDPCMVNVKDKTCQIDGCKKIPSCNFIGEKTPKFCSEHKQENMTNIVSKRCEFENCKIMPTYGVKDEKNARFCKEHKEDNMIDIKHKTCEHDKCEKRANYNFKGEKIGIFCVNHKTSQMIDIKNKTCKYKGCNLRSSYNLPGVMPSFCATHKKPGMFRNPTKSCSVKDCKEYATHGFKDPLFCENHAEKDHYNLCERKCTNQSCPYPERLDILNREGLCVTFCSLIKRDQMMKTHIKKKEEFIGNLLKTEIKQELSHRDQIIDSSCSKVRPDFVFDCGTHFVIIEVDEHQHKSYSNCGSTLEERQKMENKRMFMIFQSFGGPRTAFIRYNPDVFRVNDKVVTVGDQKRHRCLLQWVKHYLKNQPENPLEVKYLFYDGYDESDRTMISICEQDVM